MDSIQTMTDNFEKTLDRRKGDRYRAGFWILVTFLIGFIVGIFFADQIIIGRRLSEGVKLQGMVVSGKVYDIRERQ